jgi:hypothetical protein
MALQDLERDITIPEGAYRGDAKGVAVENDRTVSIRHRAR